MPILTSLLLPAGTLLAALVAAPAQQDQPAMLATMAGTWDVEQRMWTAADAPATEMPPAVAERRVPAGGGYLTETMTLAQGGPAPFTRTAHLGFNAVDGVWEYVSMDSRAPQLMAYRSQPLGTDARGPFHFAGGSFVAAEWGSRRNAGFAYRVDLSPVSDGKQRLILHLRPLEAGGAREFKAFEYLYTKRR